MDIKNYLFKGFKGCSNRDCIIKDSQGVCTNGTCSCLKDMKRGELNIVSQRLGSLIKELK